MKRIRIFIATILLGMQSHSFAETEQIESYRDPVRFLTVRCNYSDYKTSQMEQVLIDYSQKPEGNKAGTKHFKRGQKDQQANYQVAAGEVAECVFPSGNRVRAKVGEGKGRPYGMCGADPQVFTSIWVNKRKIASREWFAGHCRQEDGGSDISFRIHSFQHTQDKSFSVEKCESRPARKEAGTGLSAAHENSPLSVCVKYPEIALFPIDPLEYPGPGQKPSAVGEVRLVGGTGRVCNVLLGKLKKKFHIDDYPYYPYGWGLPQLPGPKWGDPSVHLTDELRSGEEGIFDFDNDGNLDRVINFIKEQHYMHGNVLLVQRGSSTKKLSLKGGLLDKRSWFLPCQTDMKKHEIADCPPFSSKADEAGLLVKPQKGRKSAFFRGRYSLFVPFYFQGENYLRVDTISEDTDNFIGVVRPLPGRKVEAVCLFEKTEENF